MNLARYLGRDWSQGHFDCWALVREFYAQEFGIALPLVLVNINSQESLARATSRYLNRFEPIPTPVHGCVVGLYWLHQQDDWLRHVGIYLDFNGDKRLLHNVVGAGVICQRFADLHLQNLRTQGFYTYRA